MPQKTHTALLPRRTARHLMADHRPLYLYKTIADSLRARILGKEFADGKLPSERILSEDYSANRLTLRKAMRLLEQERLIFREGTLGTFIGYPKVPDDSLGKVIGFVLVGRTTLDQMHSVTIIELERQLRRHRSQLMVFAITSEEEVDEALAGPVRSGLLSGVIATGLVSPAIAGKLRGLGAPVVLLGHMMYASPLELEFDRVYPDSVAYSCEAVKTLIDMGHKRIALVNGPSYQWFLNVCQGYMRALDENGIGYHEELVEKCDVDDLDNGFKATGRLLKRCSPTAIFAANERISAGVIEALKAHHLNTPQQMAVITVGTDRSALIGKNNIMTVAVAWDDMITSALRMLFSRMSNPLQPPQAATALFNIISPGAKRHE